MIAYEEALTACHFEHTEMKNADGTPVRARRTGKTKTWKREPTRFVIPVRYGFRTSFYIENSNAHEWKVAK